MKNLERAGEKFITNEGYEIEIIEYNGYDNTTIQFKDGTVLKNIPYAQIKTGSIKNPNNTSVFGVGYLGLGKHVSRVNGEITKSYQTWKSILEKCYSKNKMLYFSEYEDVSVCDEWHNFQVFGDWFEENWKEGLCLEKGLLTKEDKNFSPKTCCFLPMEIINLVKDIRKRKLPTGVSKVKNRYKATIGEKYIDSFKTPKEASEAYIIAKQNKIKEKADKWRPLLKFHVYQALIN